MDIPYIPHDPSSGEPSEEASSEESRRRKQEEFEREEEPAEDFARMMFKLGRRLFAHQVHVIRRIKDAHGEVQRRTMIRALGSEERFHFLRERVERNRLKSREYLTKVAALGLDQLSAWLEVQRGLLDGVFDRLARVGVAEERQAQLIDRMLGLQEEDIHRATVKSIVLFEMVRDLIRDQDDLIQKLGVTERRQLLEFALGLRKEPPDLLAHFFQDVLRKEPESKLELSSLPKEKSIQIYPLDLGTLRASSSSSLRPGTPALPPKVFELTNNSFTDKELAFFIGPCVSVAPQSSNEPWQDARLQVAPLQIETAPEPSTADGPDGAPGGPQLKMLSTVHGSITLLWHNWFHEHHQSLRARGSDHPIASDLHYRADVNVPAVRTILRISFKVVWP